MTRLAYILSYEWERLSAVDQFQFACLAVLFALIVLTANKQPTP